MKTLVKFLIAIAVAALPIYSNAQNSYIEFAEKGLVNGVEVFKAFDEYRKGAQNIEAEKEIRHHQRVNEVITIIEDTLPLVIIFATILIITLVILRYYKAKDLCQKEFINKMIDKGVFSSRQTNNELICQLLPSNNTKNIIKYNKFITEITIAGIGLGIIAAGNTLGIEWIGVILLAVGLGRIAVRYCILVYEKQEKQTKTDVSEELEKTNETENRTTKEEPENTVIEVIEAEEITKESETDDSIEPERKETASNEQEE